jgi:hypothetical protein
MNGLNYHYHIPTPTPPPPPTILAPNYDNTGLKACLTCLEPRWYIYTYTITHRRPPYSLSTLRQQLQSSKCGLELHISFFFFFFSFFIPLFTIIFLYSSFSPRHRVTLRQQLQGSRLHLERHVSFSFFFFSSAIQYYFSTVPSHHLATSPCDGPCHPT